jgi:hypothetical protein
MLIQTEAPTQVMSPDQAQQMATVLQTTLASGKLNDYDFVHDATLDDAAQVSLTDFNTGIAQWFGLGNGMVLLIDYAGSEHLQF